MLRVGSRIGLLRNSSKVANLDMRVGRRFNGVSMVTLSEPVVFRSGVRDKTIAGGLRGPVRAMRKQANPCRTWRGPRSPGRMYSNGCGRRWMAWTIAACFSPSRGWCHKSSICVIVAAPGKEGSGVISNIDVGASVEARRRNCDKIRCNAPVSAGAQANNC
eukprot:8361724-Pyramimonas_sp.AAC.1